MHQKSPFKQSEEKSQGKLKEKSYGARLIS